MKMWRFEDVFRQVLRTLPTENIPLRLAGGVAAGDKKRLQIGDLPTVAG
jgi:hypothetical protein